MLKRAHLMLKRAHLVQKTGLFSLFQLFKNNMTDYFLTRVLYSRVTIF